jgi:sulfide dehydrogenase cytochrome subunit
MAPGGEIYVKTGQTALLALLILLGGPALAEDIETLTAKCELCHGPQGVSVHGNIPIIAGQSPQFLQKALNRYQRWDRPCVKTRYPGEGNSGPKTDMCKITENLGTEDMQALATHYGAQAFVAAKQDFDEALAATGATLHNEHCERCHEGGGRLTEGSEPRLAGQWTPYLTKSINYVPTGEHMVPPRMEREVSKFSADEIDALMNYYASQQD